MGWMVRLGCMRVGPVAKRCMSACFNENVNVPVRVSYQPTANPNRFNSIDRTSASITSPRIQ